MFLYTTKNLVDVLPLRKKTFVECGINTDNLEVICLKDASHAFLEVIDEEKYNSSKLQDITEQKQEEREALMAELKQKQEQEREEAKKGTNEYKIADLEEECADLLLDSAMKDARIETLESDLADLMMEVATLSIKKGEM